MFSGTKNWFNQFQELGLWALIYENIYENGNNNQLCSNYAPVWLFEKKIFKFYFLFANFC